MKNEKGEDADRILAFSISGMTRLAAAAFELFAGVVVAVFALAIPLAARIGEAAVTAIVVAITRVGTVRIGGDGSGGNAERDAAGDPCTAMAAASLGLGREHRSERAKDGQCREGNGSRFVHVDFLSEAERSQSAYRWRRRI